MALYNELLFAHEQMELLKALRRDMRVQQDLANRSGEWTEWHQYNCRMVKRLLEAINPKRRQSNKVADVHWNEMKVLKPVSSDESTTSV